MNEQQRATVQIGRFTLRLSPLERSDLAPARKAWHRLAAAALLPLRSKECVRAFGDALGFIFIAARKNQPGLSLAELDDEAEPREILKAFKALSGIMNRLWGAEWCGPGRRGV